jgi:hypothetical protein
MKFSNVSKLILCGSMVIGTACGSYLDDSSLASGGRSRGADDNSAGQAGSPDDNTQRRGGGDDNLPGDDRGGNAPRGSEAWFKKESRQHSIRLMAKADPSFPSTVAASDVVITGATSRVTLTLVDATQLSFDCLMFDESSRSGTVIKKEVKCTQVL